MFMTKNQRTEDLAKECVIMHIPTGRLMAYDEENRILHVVEGKSNFYVFPSKSKANLAMHHQISLDKEAGKFEPWEDYKVIET
jgi:hypothetical protein